MKLPTPFNQQPLSPRYLSRVILLGLALVGYAIPSHASSQDAALSNQSASSSQQSNSSKEPSSNKRTKSPRSSQLLQTLENLFVPPQGGAPQSTANSATRDNGKCAANEATIQAMTPPRGYGLSASDRPVITLDLPPTSAQQVALLFQTESGQLDHHVWLPITQTSSQPNPESASLNLTQFQLPADLPGLKSGQRYRWSLVVVCGETIDPDDPTFMGWVEYQAPTLQEKQVLMELTLEEQQRWYGERGYWYDLF